MDILSSPTIQFIVTQCVIYNALVVGKLFIYVKYSFFVGDSDDDSNRDRHPSENSLPIDIPLSIQLTNTSGAIAMATPPRFYNSQLHVRTEDSPSASSLVMAGALHSPGRWSVMATRFNSPAESLRALWQTTVNAPSTTVSQSHPGW